MKTRTFANYNDAVRSARNGCSSKMSHSTRLSKPRVDLYAD